MDDLVSQYEGDELVEAMGLDMEREDEFLRALGAEREKAYGSVKKDVSATEWKIAEIQSSIPLIEGYLRLPPVQWITLYRLNLPYLDIIDTDANFMIH